MNLRLTLTILFSTVNPVDLLSGATGSVAEALLVLWKECELSRHAPIGTRSALIQASGCTKTFGPPVNISKWQVDFQTEEIVTGQWSNPPYDNESSFVIWDSNGVHHTIQFYDLALRPYYWYDANFDLPPPFKCLPLWRYVFIKGRNLDVVMNNGTGFRKLHDKPVISMGKSPLMDAHYSYIAPVDTVYIFNQADCREIKSYSTLGGPYDYAKPCDPSSGGFHHRSNSTDFQWLAYITKSCKYEKFTALETYPMAYVNFSNDPVWSHDPRATTRTSSAATMAPAPAQTTTVSNDSKSDIGMPVDDVFVKQDFVLLHMNDNDTPGSIAVSVVGPIVAIIFLCLMGIVAAFVLTLRSQKKKKKLGSQLESQTGPLSMISRFLGLGKKPSKSQSHTEGDDEDNPEVETPMSTKQTQQTSKGTPSMVPQDSTERRFRRNLSSRSRSHGSPKDVDETSASKNKTASKNTKNKQTGPIPSMVPYDSRHFRRNLSSRSRSYGSPADAKGTSTSKNKTNAKNTKNKRTGPLPSLVPQGSGARRFKKNLPSASRVP